MLLVSKLDVEIEIIALFTESGHPQLGAFSN
jgi:hypothetical protein